MTHNFNKLEALFSLIYECDFTHKHIHASIINNIARKFPPNCETLRSKSLVKRPHFQ